MRSTRASVSETADDATSVKATSLYPALNARYSTASTPFSRSSSSSAGGTRYGIPAWSILRRARTSRCAIVALRHEERPCDLGDRQTSDRAQRQRHPGGERQGRVAAREDQAQAIVVDVRGFRRLGSRAQHPKRRLFGSRRAQPVDRAVARRGGQPCRRAIRDAVLRPAHERRREGVLGRVLGDRPVARAPDQPRDDPGPVRPVRGRDRLGDVRQPSQG